ncbi:YobI family P-loop NTPase [Demequina lutea]|uniref:YobI-like P-loop NTPase domain-containing protein n=1 Tax=Demequina lutea TaxID=431489 RepID=A0A7Y9ZBC4_9MICO|nr:hypothetical protein [Demequina lutea]NYI40975.1 hypothetical protein [Demequina lutea]
MKQRILIATRRLINGVRSWKNDEEQKAPILLPLTPAYESDKHQVYLGVIEAALNDPERSVLNIAVTGSYGVGKSSILMEVARRHRRKVVSVSLATLGFPDDDQVPEQKKAPQAATKTNRIQKEIVKQLLYSQDPSKMPGFRYHRTTGFRLWRSVSLCALLSVPVAIVFLLAGWTQTIGALIPNVSEHKWLPHLVVFSGSTALLTALLAAFHNRIQIERLGTGAASIVLSPKSATYFDEYLDEIVYFFETAKRDIVIFEDIDRFDDAHIFETLRSLNSILNGAKQLKGRRIRFIYAVKDSIFDELGARAAKEELRLRESAGDASTARAVNRQRDDAAEAEVARANRTKFFNLVVPVVPFVTHRSARDLLVQTMDKDLDHGISDELIDLAARYVADMRLIKNIRNEYAIFKRLVLDAGDIDLKPDKLFAMVLYKSTHLADFEEIKLGKSRLDDLYRDGRELVRENVQAENATIRQARQRKQRTQVAAGQARSLGQTLQGRIDDLGNFFDGVSRRSMTFAGAAAMPEELTTPDFWERVASGDGPLVVTYNDPQLGRARTATLSSDDIERVIGKKLDSAEWVAGEHTEADAAIQGALTRREFLARADMSDLFAREEFSADIDGEDLSFAGHAKKRLTSEFAVQLVKAGYIDRNFTLYTSTFYDDRVSTNATNFILKSVDRHTIDMHFALTAEDVATLLRERGRSILTEKAIYNVDVLDYLLTSDTDGLAAVVGELVKFGDDERDLVLTYMESGDSPAELVAAMAPLWKSVFTFLASEAGVDSEVQVKLIDAALRSTDKRVAYETNAQVGALLVSSAPHLGVCVADDTSESTAHVIATLLTGSDVALASLAGLGRPVLRAVVEAGCYEITRENLVLALENQANGLSLDAIKGANELVYKRVLTDLRAYLTVLEEGEETILDAAAFGSILGDLFSADEDALPSVLEHANAGCIAYDLSKVAAETWPVLADYSRFPITFDNVVAYVDEYDVDDRLGLRLEAQGSITVDARPEEQAKVDLALAILGASDVLPEAQLRAALVGSLDLAGYLVASELPDHSGELIGWLIAENVIGDDAESFAVIAAADLRGRALAISKSREFRNFMTPAEVTPDQVGSIVASALVPTPIKSAILERLADFTVGTPRIGLQKIAQYAVDKRRALTLDETARLAAEGVTATVVVSLLRSHLPSINVAALSSILTSLGQDYAFLATKSGKHPTFPNNVAHRELAERLELLQLASSWEAKDGRVKIRMRRR